MLQLCGVNGYGIVKDVYFGMNHFMRKGKVQFESNGDSTNYRDRDIFSRAYTEI